MHRQSRQQGPALVVLALATLFAAVLLPRTAHAHDPWAYFDQPATKITHVTRQLGPGNYTVRTLNLTGGADPYMHLLRNGVEIAHDDDAGGSLNALINFTVPSTATYEIIVHGAMWDMTGFGDVWIGAERVAAGSPFGGRRVYTPRGSFSYETALAPGGAKDTFLYGLDDDLVMTQYDDNSGVGLASRITAPSRWVILAAHPSANEGLTHFYINDLTPDADGDGLGAQLEAYLGTCAQPSCPATATRPAVFNGTDTDRDGLSDKAELFGVDDATLPQYLPAWGASPLHKDVFVEVDWRPDTLWTSLPFFGADANFAQDSWYSLGKAADLLNPDGLDGVRLHLDIGDDSNPAQTVYGKWGGSNKTNDNNYLTAKDDPANFAVVRRGLFRHGQMYSGGGGNGRPGDRFHWGGGPGNPATASFVHELGHTLNLEHHGHSSWGLMNCKPHYKSVMNYAYAGGPFSQGLNTTILNPARVSERSSFPYPQPAPSYLSGAPFYFDVRSERQVDWNRDGAILDSVTGYVRAGINWATTVGCSTGGYGYQTIQSGTSLFAASPDLVKYVNRLYLFLITASGQVAYYQGVVSGADSSGSCPGGLAACMTWSAQQIVPTSFTPEHVTVTAFKNGMLLVYRRSNGELYSKYALTVNGSGNFTGWSVDQNVGVSTALPELSVMRVSPTHFNGASEVAAVFGANSSGYRMFTIPALGSTWTARPTLVNSAGQSMTGNIPPTVINWPNRGGANHSAIERACGTFTNSSEEVRFYCYQKDVNKWEDLSQYVYGGAAPDKSKRKVALAYHVFRADAGFPVAQDPTYGQFVMITLWNGYNLPTLRISNTLNQANPPGPALRMSTPGFFLDNWSYAVPGTGLALFEDESISALKAAFLRDDGAPSYSLFFMPYADGTADIALKDGNDFRVMERGICGGLRLSTAVCDSANQWGY